MQKIKELTDNFSFWQRIKDTGRPPIRERDLLIAFLLRQFFNTTFRYLVGIMKFLIQHHTVLFRYNRSTRWDHLWKRFHNYIMGRSRPGKSTQQRMQLDTPEGKGTGGMLITVSCHQYHRCIQDWVKAHVNIDEDSRMIMSYSLTDSTVHESMEFKKIWNNLPDNVTP
jgi:hypothetical protein